MKINWDETFETEAGETLMVHNTEGATETPVTLKTIALQILTTFEKDKQATGAEKYTRYEIMKKAKEKGDLSIEEVVELKKCADVAVTSPWLYGQLTDLLNQKETKFKKIEGGK